MKKIVLSLPWRTNMQSRLSRLRNIIAKRTEERIFPQRDSKHPIRIMWLMCHNVQREVERACKSEIN